MPSAKPAPRRASGAGRSAGSGRRDGAAPRSSTPRAGTSRRASQGAASPRPPRDGAERRIERTANPSRANPARGQRREREDDPRNARPAGARPAYERGVRSDRERRPRPDARPARRDARPTNLRREGGPGTGRARSDERDGSDGRDRRPRSADDGPNRGSYAGPTSERDGRDERVSYDRRPSAAPRGGRGSFNDRPRYPAKGRTAKPAPRELTPEEIERQRANTYGQKKGWGGVARRGAVSIRSEGPSMDTTPSAGFTPDPLAQWVQEVRPSKGSAPAKAKVKVKVKYALPGDVAADVRRAFIGT